MWTMPGQLALAVALICAAVMGFAIQRGATCAVVAVEEVLAERRATRLAAMTEASLWVAGGLVIANAIGLAAVMPPGFELGARTMVGGILLGLGAFVNGACAFGSIARLGRGEWVYVATPLGFFLGCLSFGPLIGASPSPMRTVSPVLLAPAWAALPVTALFAWRLFRPALAIRRAGGWGREFLASSWSPHAATVVIGIAFVIMLIGVGAWSYTEALGDLARGAAPGLPLRGLLLLALLAGAVLGGWSAGQLGHRRVTAAQLFRCLAGGAIMAWGGLLVPGANDGLILLAMPLLAPYAWVAFAAMCAAIATMHLLARRYAAVSA
ncbi:YeeE/YedE thiosulfate transporter family protein [Falsiroseomonas sp. HW251]|uniref:YeeE/YedE thiosulfate transporter family protein n=1 Tax=Falsiroseomonas sp. HW251 TaxID=3390998 RepID=UPI003D315C2F